MPFHSVIVIGAGPGGYAAALEAAVHGLPVTLINAREIGGACLNRGCIPSKFYLAQARYASGAAMPERLAQKESILSLLRQRMEQAVKSAGVRRVTGQARFVSPHAVSVESASAAPVSLEADAFILATGSAPVRPALFPDHPAVLTSDTIFSLESVPAHLAVIGGGYIGCELACAFQGFGSKVTLIEKEAALLAAQPEFDGASAVLQRSFEKRGMTVWTRTEVRAAQALDAQKIRLSCSNGETIDANAVLLALGRRPNLEALHLEKAGIPGPPARFTVNASMQTAAPHIYAIGDMVSPLPLAHTAAKEAEIAVRHLLSGETRAMNYAAVPRVVYTRPEAAFVGLTESQARAQGFTPRIDRTHFAANAKAMVEQETEGFWLIISDAASRQILGALIVGSHATELIHLAALSLKAGLTAADIADTVFAHPTLSEGFTEAMKRSLLPGKTPRPTSGGSPS